MSIPSIHLGTRILQHTCTISDNKQFHSFSLLFCSGRAIEVVEYWKYCGEDKQSIVQCYNNVLQSMGQLKSPQRDGAGSSKRRHSIFPDHIDVTLTSVMQAHIYESAGRFFRDLGLMEDVS